MLLALANIVVLMVYPNTEVCLGGTAGSGVSALDLPRCGDSVVRMVAALFLLKVQMFAELRTTVIALERFGRRFHLLAPRWSTSRTRPSGKRSARPSLTK